MSFISTARRMVTSPVIGISVTFTLSGLVNVTGNVRVFSRLLSFGERGTNMRGLANVQ